MLMKLVKIFFANSYAFLTSSVIKVLTSEINLVFSKTVFNFSISFNLSIAFSNLQFLLISLTFKPLNSYL